MAKFKEPMKTESEIEVGDIMVVPSSDFLKMPAFFKVVAKGLANTVHLRTLGAKTEDDETYIPSGVEYHDSIYREKNGKVNTWCGTATKWDGRPC